MHLARIPRLIPLRLSNRGLPDAVLTPAYKLDTLQSPKRIPVSLSLIDWMFRTSRSNA